MKSTLKQPVLIALESLSRHDNGSRMTRGFATTRTLWIIQKCSASKQQRNEPKNTMHTRKSSDEVPHCSLISSFEQKLNFIAAGKYDELLSKMLLSLKSKYLNK